MYKWKTLSVYNNIVLAGRVDSEIEREWTTTNNTATWKSLPFPGEAQSDDKVGDDAR